MAITKVLLVATSLLLCVFAASNVNTYKNIIAGGFTSVDSQFSDSAATYVHPSAAGTQAAKLLDTVHYSGGQFLPHFAQSSAFQSATVNRVYADDGSVFGLLKPAVQGPANEIYYYDNTTSAYGQRLFGVNGFFGADVAQANGNPSGNRPAGNYQLSIQNIAVVGQSPSRTLFVCFGAPAALNGATRLVTGTTLINGVPFNGNAVPLGPQLVAFQESATGFLSSQGTVNSLTAPTVVTPAYQQNPPIQQVGVDCSTLFAKAGVVVIKTAVGPYWYTTNPQSITTSGWTALTRDPDVTGFPLGLGLGPVNSFYIQDTTKNIYVLAANPGTLGNPPVASDTVVTIYRLNPPASNSWTAVISPTPEFANFTINGYVVGNGGDSEIYFTLAQTANQYLPNYVDNINLPLQQYVFTTSGVTGTPFTSFNYLNKLWQLYNVNSFPLALHYEPNNKGYLVVYNAVTYAIVGNRQTYVFPDDDVKFYSKQFNNIVRYDSTGSQWLPAYGGGFDGDVSRIVSTASGLTLFEGTFSFAFQTFTGPIAVYNTNKNFNRWVPGYGVATSGLPDIDGGDYHGIYNGNAVVDVVVPLTLGTKPGWVVAGNYRTTDNLATVCNSICFFPASGGGKTAFAESGGNAGVRLADATTQVPEHTQYKQGSITSVVVTGDYMVVAGTFNIVGGQYTSNFGVWNFKSNTWSTANGGVNGAVNSLVVVDNVVYVGGTFSVVGQNVLAKNVAAYNPKTGRWSSLNRGLDDTVNKLVNLDGTLLAVGAFTTGSGQTLGYAGVWQSQAWRPLNYFGGKNDSSACNEKFCSAADLTNSITDALVVDGDLFVTGGGANGGLYKYRGGSHGWENVDGGAINGGQNNAQFSTKQTYVRGGQFLGQGTSSHTVDLWGYVPNDQAFSSSLVSTYSTSKKNFLDNQLSGTNGPVFFTAPQNTHGVSSAISVAASVTFLVALVFALLML